MNVLRFLSFPLILSLLFVACESQHPTTIDEEQSTNHDSELRDYIDQLGFRKDMIEDRGDHFVVEGDIVFTKDDLRNALHRLRKTSQAATQYAVEYELVDNIVVKIDASIPTSGDDNWRVEIEDAMDEWTDITGSAIVFVLNNAASTPDILVKSDGGVLGDQVIASAFFPNVDGEPGSEIKINLDFNSNQTISSGQKKYNMAHEFGHTIGLRHTNWQGQGESSANTLPRTPSGSNPDVNSVMNGGTADYSWAGFSSYDIVAAEVLYPSSLSTPEITNITQEYSGLGNYHWVHLDFTTDNKAAYVELWRKKNSGSWTLINSYLQTYSYHDEMIENDFTSPVYWYKIRVKNYKADVVTSYSNEMGVIIE